LTRSIAYPSSSSSGHDRRREVNSGGAQLGKSDRLLAGLARPLEQSLLLDVSERHRSDCRPSGGWGRLASWLQICIPEGSLRHFWAR
jgi:hypothetical protein